MKSSSPWGFFPPHPRPGNSEGARGSGAEGRRAPLEPRLDASDTWPPFSGAKHYQTTKNKTAENGSPPYISIHIHHQWERIATKSLLFIINLPFKPSFTGFGVGAEIAKSSFHLKASFHPIISTIAFVFPGNESHCISQIKPLPAGLSP